MTEHDIWDLVIRDMADSTLLLLGLLVLGKVNCHVMKTAKQCYEEVHVVIN